MSNLRTLRMRRVLMARRTDLAWHLHTSLNNAWRVVRH